MNTRPDTSAAAVLRELCRSQDALVAKWARRLFQGESAAGNIRADGHGRVKRRGSHGAGKRGRTSKRGC
jgi:hypothetical protein